MRRVSGRLSVEREVRAPHARRRAGRALRCCRGGSHGGAREPPPASPMIDVPAPQRAQAAAIQHRLSEGLARIDPHHRLLGRPVAYRIIDGTTLEITYRDVPGIAEAEVLGVKRLIGVDCFCTVAPQTAECVTVRFVVSLK